MESESRKILGLILLRIGARLTLVSGATSALEKPDWLMLGVYVAADVLVEIGAYLFNPKHRPALSRLRRKKEVPND